MAEIRRQSKPPSRSATQPTPQEDQQDSGRSATQPTPQEDQQNSGRDDTPLQTNAGKDPEPINKQSFMFGNIYGLLSQAGRVAKIPILQRDCHDNKYLFLAFTESHLNNTSKEAEYHIPGYSHILCNREERSMGGVILYIKNDLTYKILTSKSDNMCSLLAIKINELDVTVFLAYRPPPKNDGLNLEASFNEIVIENIEREIRSLGTPSPNVLIMGDFNFPNATWNEGTATERSDASPEGRMFNKLIGLCETYQLLQKVPFGTRMSPTGRDNMLDLIFTNNHRLLGELRKINTAMSDHSLIEVDMAYHFGHHTTNHTAQQHPEPNLSSFNLHKADWQKIRCFIGEQDWNTLLMNKSNEEKLQAIVSIVFEALEKFCPKYKSRRGQTKSKIPRDRRILFRQKKRKRKILKEARPDSQKALRLQTEIKQIETRIADSLLAECALEEEKAVNNIKTNPKYFFTYAKKRQKVKGDIGPLKVGDNLIVEPEQICECLSTQYSSVYSPCDPNNTIDDPLAFFNLDSAELPKLQDITFSEERIEEEIGSLRNNSAAGPDHFPALLLKKCKKELKKPLYILWRSSLDECDIAQLLKHAITCPVLKNNSVSYLPKSYRPVSLTSHLIKVFEKIVAKEIVTYLIENELLPWNQHGFLNGRSTVSQLLNQAEIILRYLENGNCSDTIYLDFAKAFDKVDHFLLCKKLKEKGIGGKVGAWLHNFLTNRTLQVSANGALSSPAPVLSGVPQGTVLGPVLFIIMISDIDTDLNHAFMSLFADDSRVTRKITNEADRQILQNELNNVVYPWATRNNAVFNGDKFEHIHFHVGDDHQPWQYLDPDGNPITNRPEIKDLGITIANDLSWSHHIDKTVSKCRMMAAWILRTFTKRDITTMRTLWTTILRPLVDYCSPVWSPKPESYGDIDKLEGILRSFSKHVEGLELLPYGTRLRAMNLHSIQRRHERYKIIYLYKMKENMVPSLPRDPLQPEISFALQFDQQRSQRTGTRCDIPNPKLYHNPGLIARQSSFAETASNLWNKLPSCITNISNKKVDYFKRKLDSLLDIVPDEPRFSATGRFRDHANRITNSIKHILSDIEIRAKVMDFNRQQQEPSVPNRGGPQRGDPPSQ